MGLYHTLQPQLFSPRIGVPGQNRFAVIGDPGSGDSHQWAIAQQLLQAYEKAPFASVLVLGDNVYEDGEPHLFKERIYDPYAPLFEKGVRFYPILGNHDVRKGFEDQQLQVWGAPEFYSFRLANNQIEIFAIDTTVFLPFVDNARAYNPTLAQKKADIELTWLETALAKSTAPTKIVMGHYPIYSSGDHATKEKAYIALRNTLQPMFEKYGVSLYLSGHEHHYEKSAPIGGVTHIVSGAAGKLLDTPWPAPKDYPRDKHIPRFHMMLFDAQADGSLTYETLGDQGDLLDRGTIPPAVASASRGSSGTPGQAHLLQAIG